MTIHLEVVTPKGPTVDVKTTEVDVPGAIGEFGVLAGHIPVLAALKAGVLRYRTDGKQSVVAISTGFAEVGANDHLLVLTDYAAKPEDIDTDAVRARLAETEKALAAWVGEINSEHQDLVNIIAWCEAQLAAKAEA